jgi:hypothetical protein
MGMFSACGDAAPEATTAAPTEAEQTGPLKVLVIGNSASTDAGHLLHTIAAAEGFERELILGILYHSGCPMSRHVENSVLDRKDYSFYLSSSATPDQPRTETPNTTLLEGLRFMDWNVIVIQGSTATNYKEDTFTNGDLQKLQAYVDSYKLNKDAIYMWHMFAANSQSEELIVKWEIQTGNGPEVSSYRKIYQQFATRADVFAAITGNVEKYIMTDSTISALIPAGTAVENALTSYLEEAEINRDYVHLSDFSRVVSAYTWYCVLAGIDHLDEIKLDAIGKTFLKSTEDKTRDRVLTEAEKAIILESVNNALATPLKVTQSQYTEAPAQ